MAERVPQPRHGSIDKPLPAALDAKPEIAYVEQVPTNDSLPEHEKNGSRPSDEEQANFDPDAPMSFARIMSLVAMAFLWTGSQIPVYLFGAVPPYIYRDIGGVDRWVWFVLANLLSLAAVCPFVGSISDLFGRRYVAIAGAGFLVVAMVICSTVHDMNYFICGMVFAGVGAGINELTALAATSELAPTRKRGKYVAVLVFTILPFIPSVLYGQLVAYYSTWRWLGLFCGLWAFIGLVFVVLFYFPPPRTNSQGLSTKEILNQVDYIGGILSISGMLLFMLGMQWGGYQYDWNSAHVLAPLILGILLIIAFVVWETYAPHPMFPRRLQQEPRILCLTLVITFISGANFFSILMFWPTQAFNVYGHDPIGVGIRGLPVSFGILGGAVIVLWLLSVFRGHNKELMIASSVLMTAGCGSLAAAKLDNLNTIYALLFIAGLGIGGIVVPASIVSTIVTPDDLIATVAALTLAIRVIGGSVGYCVYYNVFVSKFTPKAMDYIGGYMTDVLNITSEAVIGEVIELTGASLIEEIAEIPGIAGVEGAWEAIVRAGQIAYAEAYVYVYLVSIAFGAVSIVAAAFLGDISKYMDDHIAVAM